MKLIILPAVLILIELFRIEAQCRQSVTTVGGSHRRLKEGPICAGDLIFDEEFDSLNENIWNHELQVNGCGNGEFEQYVNDRSISYVQDGELFIRPKVVGDRPLNDGYYNPVKSARMTTAGHFFFRYGRVEARAKLPAGDWLWPAIWMKPENYTYGDWPRNGEIDIMESRGNKQLTEKGANIGTQLMFSTLHWGQERKLDQYKKTHYEQRNGTGYDTDYHNYIIEWTPNYIAFEVDEQEIGRITPPDGGFYEYGNLSGENPWAGASKMAPFDQEFYLLLNVAIGGTSGYFPDDALNPSEKPWKNFGAQPESAEDFWSGNEGWRPTWKEQTTESAMKVQHIKVYAN